VVTENNPLGDRVEPKRVAPRDIPPQSATEEELEEEARRSRRIPLSTGSSGYRRPNNGGSSNPFNMQFIMIMAVVALAISYLMIGFIGVSKNDFTTNFQSVATSISGVQASVKADSDKIGAIQSTVNGHTTQITTISTKADNAVNTANNAASKSDINGLQTKIDNMQASVTASNTKVTDTANSLNIKMDGLAKNESDLSIKITTLQTDLAAAIARIAKLETVPTTPTPTTPAKVVIPNTSIAVSVTDEGTLQSDNSTVGELKLTLSNEGTKDIVDVVLDLFVYFDDGGNSAQSIVSSTYGTWSIRERNSEEIQLRGRLSRLTAGQTKRIYINIKSYANQYELGNRTTYMEASASDIDIIDWNY
jgi:hypothetical protein